MSSSNLNGRRDEVSKQKEKTKMTRHRLVSTALLVLFGIAGLSAVRAVEPKAALTKKELKTAIASAKTPEEHYRIAAYFTSQAERMLAEAKEHDELAALYAESPNPAAMKQPMSGRTAEHCRHFAEYARKAAQQDQELAKMHRDMAKQAK